MSIIEKAVNWAVSVANDNSHGYSQASRWGPDYDCSSLVIQAWENAGVPVKSRGATYTGNMRSVFLACGFRDVTTQVGLASGYGLQPGDVLLNEAAHAAMYIGGGRVVHARSSEGNSLPGDQSGNEVRIQPYWNYWNCVLRYREPTASASTPSTSPAGASAADKPSAASTATPNSPASNPSDHTWHPATLRTSNTFSADCVVLQALLNVRGFHCGSADGLFGPKTQAALNAAQAHFGLTVDGICGPKTWEKLLEVT